MAFSILLDAILLSFLHKYPNYYILIAYSNFEQKTSTPLHINRYENHLIAHLFPYIILA